jgi:hypothetical protein
MVSSEACFGRASIANLTRTAYSLPRSEEEPEGKVLSDRAAKPVGAGSAHQADLRCAGQGATGPGGIGSLSMSIAFSPLLRLGPAARSY